jgi:hypothetical protein
MGLLGSPRQSMTEGERATMEGYNVDDFQEREYPMLKGEFVFSLPNVSLYSRARAGNSVD